MEPMYYGCGGSNLAPIRSKADAMKFAIETSCTFKDCNTEIHLDKAKEIFQMFVENINLPDVPNETSDKVLNEVMNFAKQYLGARYAPSVSRLPVLPPRYSPRTKKSLQSYARPPP